ncbi:MAG: hypothetical protein EA383_12515 [Spirochaetaceae bacterium]|nr:MAG: hypothetical protein EA383_12515 [Spirochaetaceae bacterium]
MRNHDRYRVAGFSPGVFFALIALVLFSCRSGTGDVSSRIDEVERRAREAGVPSYYDGYSSVPGTRSVRFDTPVRYFSRQARDGVADSDFFDNADDLAVVDYGPVGTLPAGIRRPQVYVVFDSPVMPLQALSGTTIPSGLLRIEPDVEGTVRALGSRMFLFEPAQDLEGQHEYRVSVSLRSDSSVPLLQFVFQDEELDLLRVHAGSMEFRVWGDTDDLPPEEARVFTLEFNYPVTAEVVKDYLSVIVGEDLSDFELRHPEMPTWMSASRSRYYVELHLDDTPPVETSIQIALETGARSTTESTVGTSERQAFDFATVRPFSFQEVTTRSYRFPGGWEDEPGTLYLQFSHDIESGSIGSRIWMYRSGWVDVSDHADVAGSVVRLRNLPAGFEESVRIELRSGLADRFGRSINEDLRVTADLPPATGRFTMPETGNRIMESSFAPRIWFSYRNLDRADFAAGSIDHPFFPSSSPPYTALDLSESEPNVPRLEVMDLEPFLDTSGSGAVEVRWNVVPRPEPGRRALTRSGTLRVQSTDIGLITRYARNRVLVWAQRMSDGSPVAGASVTVSGPGGRAVAFGQTDAQGFSAIALEESKFTDHFVHDRNLELYVTVEDADDSLVVSRPGSHSPYQQGIFSVVSPQVGQAPDPDVWMATDRGIYRPGEAVHIAGFDRDRADGGFVPRVGSYELRVRHPWGVGEDLYRTSGQTDRDGAFDVSFEVPEGIDPGRYVVRYTRDGRSSDLYFDVAYFEPASVSVSQVITPDLLIAGNEMTVLTSAEYLSGGVPQAADLRLNISAEPHEYGPESFSRSGYRFGPREWTSAFSVGVHTDNLDAAGMFEHVVETRPAPQAGRAYRYTVQSAVTDASERETADRRSVIVHPSDYYFGVRLADQRWFFTSGETIDGEVLIVRPLDSGSGSNSAVHDAGFTGAATLTLSRHVWRTETTAGPAGAYWRTYERETIPEVELPLQIEAGQTSFQVQPGHTGSYTVEIRAEDHAGRPVVTAYDFFVTGADVALWSYDFEGQIRLDPEESLYEPGETARILLRSPLESGEYLVTVEQAGILDEFFVHIDGSTGVIEVPIREDYAPVVYVGVYAASPRSEMPPDEYGRPDLGRPAGYYGMTTIPVSTEHRRLDVVIGGLEHDARPGERIELDVSVRSDGRPVADQRVLLIGVDRGVVDLINYRIPDPISHMYRRSQFPLAVQGGDSRNLLVSPVLFESRNLHGGGGGGKADAEAARSFAAEAYDRSDFSRLAVFDVSGRTDADGRVNYQVDLPDTLTTWRFSAVAFGSERFGIAEREVRASLPVNVRPDLPRMLRIRDTAELGVLLTNTTGQDVDASVSFESDDGQLLQPVLAFHSPQSVQVRIGAGETMRVPFLVSAQAAGIARLSLLFESDVLVDQSYSELEVVVPSTRETVSTSSLMEPDAGEVDQILFPLFSLPGSEQVSIRVRTDRLTALDEARDRLEQTTTILIEHMVGRVYGSITVGDGDADIEELFRTLGEYQQADGGIPLFDGFRASHAATSSRIGVMYADMRASHYDLISDGISASGFDSDSFERYLETVFFGSRFDAVTRLTAGYALTLLGRLEDGSLSGFERDMEPRRLGHAEQGLLALSYLNLGDRDQSRTFYDSMKSHVLVSERSVELREPLSVARSVDTPVSTLARMYLLSATFEPQTVYSGRIAESLELRRGRGLSATEAVWVVHVFTRSALNDGEHPRQDIRARIGSADLGVQEIGGDAERSVRFEARAADITAGQPGEALPVMIEGAVSPLWYRLQMSYLLPTEALPPRDQGISVIQQFLTIDGSDIDAQDLVGGTTYRIRTTLNTGVRRSMVAVTIPVASGLEILDTRLETTAGYGDVSSGPGRVYDNEYRVFLHDLLPGAIEFEFLVRARIPGVFPSPPADATLVYEPEVFGRSEGHLVQIQRRE